MTPEVAYFLKVNVAFVLFYAFYRLFFYKDTFFQLRRAILLVFFGMALVYPLFNFEEWVRGQEPIVEVAMLYSAMLPEVTPETAEVAAQDWTSLFMIALKGVYWVVLGAFIIRFLVQLGSIFWLKHTCRRALVQDTRVYVPGKPSGPFSFFGWIFLHPESHSEKETGEILMHEKTHVSQWHSIDVLISEWICMLCWMNPFVWLLRREVRYNLEYLADHTVLESGCDTKAYQYHLLGLAHQPHKAAANLYNNFNVLHLKNRISMMNRKRSRAIGKAKYLVFLPLAAMLMLLSNIEAVARITKNLAETIPAAAHADETVKVTGSVIDTGGTPIVGAVVLVKGSTTGTVTDLDGKFVLEAPAHSILVFSMINHEKKEIKIDNGADPLKVVLAAASEVSKGQILNVVDEMPQYPGGENELLKFIARSVKYPVEAQKNKKEGRVVCSFVVNADGSVTDLTVARGVDPLLDQEALRVLGTMPAWTPGKQNGQTVNVRYTLPITFSLSGKSQEQTTAQTPAEGQDPSTQVFSVVEVMPQFPGGEKALVKYVSDNIKYPKIAHENGIQGRVVCSFIVNTDGSISDMGVVRGVDPSLDKEAMRVLSGMPKWTPGSQRGKVVRVKYTVPVTFRLDDGNVNKQLDEIVVIGYGA